MIFGTSMAILTCAFPPGERGKAIGISTAAVYLGLSLGPVVGGFLVHRFGWRSIFFAVVPVGLAGVVLTLVRLRGEWDEARGEKFDAFGSGIFGLGLAALMYGFSRLPSLFGGGLVAAGLALLGAFILWEKRVSAPVLDVRLFRANRVFAFSNAAALINYSATSAASFLLSLYLQYVKGLPPQKAGLVLVAQPVVMALFSPLAGKASDRIEPRIVASVGMAISSAGLFALVFLGPETPLGFITAALLGLGFGFALFSSPNTNAVMCSVERRAYGVAASTLGTMRLTGQMLSLGISVLIIAVFVGNVRIGPANLPLFLKSARTAFAVFGALCVLGRLRFAGPGEQRREGPQGRQVAEPRLRSRRLYPTIERLLSFERRYSMGVTRKDFLKMFGLGAASAGLFGRNALAAEKAETARAAAGTMKIKAIEIFKFDIQLTSPFRISLGTLNAANDVLVKVHTDSGLVGFGEACPFPPITGETQETNLSMARSIREMLIGRNPLAIESLVAEMGPMAHSNPSVVAAYDMALFDILGKAAGLPVFRLLGGDKTTFETDITWASTRPRPWRPRRRSMPPTATRTSRSRSAWTPTRMWPGSRPSARPSGPTSASGSTPTRAGRSPAPSTPSSTWSPSRSSSSNSRSSPGTSPGSRSSGRRAPSRSWPTKPSSSRPTPSSSSGPTPATLSTSS